jgi:hypothetical protein
MITDSFHQTAHLHFSDPEPHHRTTFRRTKSSNDHRNKTAHHQLPTIVREETGMNHGGGSVRAHAHHHLGTYYSMRGISF